MLQNDQKPYDIYVSLRAHKAMSLPAGTLLTII